MKPIEKQIERIELQIEQLITIVANLNRRINRLEENEQKRKIQALHTIPIAKRM